jgi:pentatricopeptide repeat protein
MYVFKYIIAQVLQEAEEKSFRPEETTYVELIAACERAGHWRRALALLEDMRKRECVKLIDCFLLVRCCGSFHFCYIFSSLDFWLGRGGAL